MRKVRKKFILTIAMLLLTGMGNSALAGSIAPISVNECQKLTPVMMAERSEYVMKNYDYLLTVSMEIANPELRSKVSGFLKNPVASVMQRYSSAAAKEELKQQLAAAGYIKPEMEYQQFLPWS
jgi:hypothetical protein